MLLISLKLCDLGQRTGSVCTKSLFTKEGQLKVISNKSMHHNVCETI